MDSLPFSQHPSVGFSSFVSTRQRNPRFSKKNELDHTLLSETTTDTRICTVITGFTGLLCCGCRGDLRQAKHNRELRQQSEAEDRVEHANDEER